MNDQEQKDYFWTAETKDGTMLSDGYGNTVEEVFALNKKGKIRYFILVMPDNTHSKIVVDLTGKRKLIFFKTKRSHAGFNWVCTAVGWSETVSGVVREAIAYIYPNGGIELTHDKPTLLSSYHEAFIKQVDEYNKSKVDTLIKPHVTNNQ